MLFAGAPVTTKLPLVDTVPVTVNHFSSASGAQYMIYKDFIH
jgi:hypothetical protein